MPTVRVRFEQAVYGSFAFWDRGYALLAQSPGCRPEWLAEFLAACQRHGEPRGGSPEARSLFSLRLKSGPWIVVGVSPQGHDDRGRPGALAFHALFLSPRDYRKAGHVPFGLSGALRGDWTAETRTLPSGAWPVEVPGTPETPHDPRALPIAAIAGRGGRVALEEAGPIDALAREVWLALPDRARRRASVATWAFGNGNRFDLVALPRLAGVELDSSYVDPALYPLPRERVAEGRVRVPASARARALRDLGPGSPLVRETHPVRPRGPGHPGRHPARPRAAADDGTTPRRRPPRRCGAEAPRPFDRRRGPDHPRRASPRGRGAAGSGRAVRGHLRRLGRAATPTRPR